MAFISPFANLSVMLLNDRHHLPWITTEKLIYESPLTGEEYEVPQHFRTDLVSVPTALAALPVIGTAVLLEFFGTGVWKGAREGALHDYLRTPNSFGKFPVPPIVAHRVFREALYAANYDHRLCELYYRAVVTFNP